jgi:G:T-mismatch repair DNA endonuclease (very short patch repair protein)
MKKLSKKTRRKLSLAAKRLWRSGRHPLQNPKIRSRRNRKVSESLKINNPMFDFSVRSRHLTAVRDKIRRSGHWTQTKKGRLYVSERSKRFHAEGIISIPAKDPEVAARIAATNRANGRKRTRAEKLKQSRIMKKYYAEGRMVPPSKRDDVRKKISEAQKRNFALIPKGELSRRGKEMRAKARFLKPTSIERRISEACERFGFHLRYVGNGKLWLNHNGRLLNPDFIEMNGKMKIVEAFGDYWHRDGNPDVYAAEKKRVSAYRDLGYDTLVLWESEMKRMSDGDLATRLKAFLDEPMKISMQKPI